MRKAKATASKARRSIAWSLGVGPSLEEDAVVSAIQEQDGKYVVNAPALAEVPLSKCVVISPDKTYSSKRTEIV